MNDRDRFDRFTERARKVLSLAQEEAQRFHHNYIGTEHLLLGLIREEEGVGARVLQSLGVELKKVRSAVEFIIGRGERIVLGEIGLTPRAKKVISLAVDEAQRMNHHYIGTEHLLLGLIGEGEGIAAGILRSLGVTAEKARKATLNMLHQVGQPGAENVPAIEQEALDISPNAPLQTPPPVGQRRFDRFTERSRKVMTLAQAEAQRFQHSYIGTEHVLLGLVREGQGVGARVLSNLGATSEKIRTDIEFIIGRGDRIVLGEIGLTPRAKHVIELSVEEARNLHHHYIGTEHLLLGLLREDEGIAAGVLNNLGITLDKARAETINVLSSLAHGQAQQAPPEDATDSDL